MQSRMCFFILLSMLFFSACSNMKMIKNDVLAYRLAIPPKWKASAANRIESPIGESLKILRLRTDVSLEKIADKFRRALGIEQEGFSTEEDDFKKVNGLPTWQMLGSYKASGEEQVLYKVVIDTGEFKYILDFYTSPSSYRRNKKVYQKIVKSFSVIKE